LVYGVGGLIVERPTPPDMGAGASIALAGLPGMGKKEVEEEEEDNASIDMGHHGPKKSKAKVRGHGRDSDMGKAAGENPDSAAAKKKKKKGPGDDDPVMDRRLYDWLPPPARDIDGDREALQTLYSGCDGAKWYIKIGWKTYDDPAKWYGVAVEKVHHAPRVRGLELKGNTIKGKAAPATRAVVHRDSWSSCASLAMVLVR
jgi:hypothetical protein